MSRRQKSFFEQDSKTRPTWQPHWKTDKVSLPAERPHTAAPFPASTSSKAKLNAFRFHEETPKMKSQGKMEAVDSNKENLGKAAKPVSPSQMNPPPQPSSKLSTGKEVRDCPQTPIGRLPLSELLAAGDDSRQNVEYTPIERVLWENSPVNVDLTSSNSTRRKRKRAHSSSPASSSQNEVSSHFADAQTSRDVPNLPVKLRTPKADPADALWSRFASDRRSPLTAGGSLFPQLMQSSSPQTPGPPAPKDSGLRRAFSCIEWPTSAAKRRKMHHSVFQRETAAVFADSDHSAERSKMSRVSMLIEKMQNGLSKPREPPTILSSEPSKSSPTAIQTRSPIRGTDSFESDSSDVDNVATGFSQATVDEAAAVESDEPLPKGLENVGKTHGQESSEFGDDDLDLEMIEAANDDGEQTLTQAEIPAQILPEKGDSSPSSDHQESDQYVQSKTRPPIQVARQANNYDAMLQGQSSHLSKQKDDLHEDEFDEDDAGEFAADLDDVCAKYDTQRSAHLDAPRTDRVANSRMATSTSFPIVNTQRHLEVISDDEDFGDDSDFEQLAAECAQATQDQKPGLPSQSMYDRKAEILQRYVITSVASSEYDSGDGRRLAEKILSIQCETTKAIKAITLRQAWLDSPCTSGSYVHVVGDFDRYGHCIVDDSQNLLILHPDHLISSTVVGDSFTCTRKAVLQDRVKSTSDPNQAMIYGKMLHEIFQEALKANRWDDDFMSTLIEQTCSRYLEELFEVSIEQVMAADQLKARAKDLQAWAAVFMSTKPRPNAVVRGRSGGQALMSVNKLLEVEEHVWSPMYGLKGNIDATVQIHLQEKDGARTLTVPFELKTGKNSDFSHQAQTALYSLLLSDRYGEKAMSVYQADYDADIYLAVDVEIACGILYYMQSSEILSIRSTRHDLVSMIVQRNELASFVRNRTKLPEMLRRAYTCGKCYAQTPCFIYHKLLDEGTGETSGIGEKFDDAVRHLNAAHQSFFRKWDLLLTKEESNIVKFRRELWSMQSSEREKVGRCFGGLIVIPNSFQENADAPKANRFRYSLEKQEPAANFTFTESQIVLGEPIVISDERGHFALANGFVTGVRRQRIEVTVDRRLHNVRSKKKGFDANTNQAFSGIMEIVEQDNVSATATPQQPEEPVIYRLDKDEFSNGMALVRNNLIRLMEKDVFGVHALRRLIVDLMPPTFNAVSSHYSLGDMATQDALNVDQRAAIEKVMSAKDYALVLGMPGTGKTTTIAHIIRALVGQGKSVLLTAYTHSAVDNILLKLKVDKIGIFRIGAIAKVHHEVREFADLGGLPMKSIEELKACYTRQVVATTCLGINHAVFNQRIFDYCIVDEASQITLPVCLGPIRMAKKFILVGDHFQLPPLVQNKEALEGGLDVSLFKTLSEQHPTSVTNLEHQYRMCEEIMTLSNTLIYDGRLKCGTESVAHRALHIPNIGALEQHHYTADTVGAGRPRHICLSPSRKLCWIRDLLEATTKACFVNTDALLPQSREVLEHGSRITNPCEVMLMSQIVESLMTVGISPTDIGVVTLYRSQLALMRQSLRHRSGVEMNTADKFQGRDKEVVVLSLVRSNEQQSVGELLKDWRRVNVALTRARTKLLILGSKSTLVGNELLKDLIELMSSKEWWYDLPRNACEGHVFEDAGTQISGKGSLEPTAEAVNERKTALGTAGYGKENRMGRRVPAKQGKLDMKALLGKRPVLRDIVNDAS